MPIIIYCALTNPMECSFEVTDQELDVMVAEGVDVRDEDAAADFYRKHLGEKLGDIKFMDLRLIAEQYQDTSWAPEINYWYAMGEAPDKYWPITEEAQSG